MTKEELIAEIAKTKAATEQLVSSTSEEEQLTADLEQARRELSDAQAIRDAEEKFGKAYRYGEDENVEARKIAAVPTDLGVVIVKRPHQALVRRFQSAKDASADETMKLVGPSLVYPARTRFDEMLKDQDMILPRVARAALELAGFRAKELAGKV